MTLTTERLREIASSPSFSANPLSHEVKYMARELLANREAQPVALVDRRPAASGGICWQHGGKDLPHGTELFTTPPAPAVPPEATPENIENLLADITLFFTAGSLSRGGAVMFAEVWNACRAAMLAQPVSSGYKLPEGWIACSERMPDNDETKPIAIYTGKCLGQGMFVATYDEDGFFDYWEGGEIIGVTHWMPLPAAPEGGNG